MGEFDRFKFYAHMKVYLAAPPDVLRVDEKNLREHSVFNVCGVELTTNHKVDGIYLPADDRGHFVAWSDCKKEDFDKAHWNGLWSWYEREGFGHVADRAVVEALVAEHAPQGPTEEHLVEELAGILWRKRRLRLAEGAAHRRGLEEALSPETARNPVESDRRLATH
jgi:hypothetical protein